MVGKGNIYFLIGIKGFMDVNPLISNIKELYTEGINMDADDYDRICLALDYYLCNVIKDENEKDEYLRLLLEYDEIAEKTNKSRKKIEYLFPNVIKINFREDS